MKPKLSSPSLGIAAVERDTGLGKDTLRVWERRYGFPLPLRDAAGERLYPAEQVSRLRLIKRLLDQGLRPGKLLGLDTAALQVHLDAAAAKVGAGNTAAATATATAGAEEAGPAAADDMAGRIVALLRERAVERLRAELAQHLAREGLHRFVMDTMPAMNRRIGEAWVAGELEVFEEHLYTELLQNQLRAAIHSLPQPQGQPRALLTTLKGEEHLLGLLMFEALMAAEGAACVSLGAQTPVVDIVSAVARTTPSIVALSFSAAYPWRKARDALLELRAALPAQIEIWAGGGTLAVRAAQLPGIVCFDGIAAVPAAVTDWRSRQQNRSLSSRGNTDA